MKFIFIYTNEESLRVDCVRGVTAINVSTVNNVVVLNVHYSLNGVVGENVYRLSEGTPAIMWE